MDCVILEWALKLVKCKLSTGGAIAAIPEVNLKFWSAYRRQRQMCIRDSDWMEIGFPAYGIGKWKYSPEMLHSLLLQMQQKKPPVT